MPRVSWGASRQNGDDLVRPSKGATVPLPRLREMYGLPSGGKFKTPRICPCKITGKSYNLCRDWSLPPSVEDIIMPTTTHKNKTASQKSQSPPRVATRVVPASNPQPHQLAQFRELMAKILSNANPEEPTNVTE